jgi:radical SAM protein with 4Fe4S-binding SPASM domain
LDCPYIPDLSYGEFRKRFRQKVATQRIPLSGSLELNFRCNLRCQHCYVAYGHRGISGKSELSFAEIQRILDEIVDAGCLWLLLTGGEPLVRRDFLDIYTYAKRKGLLVSLFTNGTLLNRRIADYLAEYRPFNLEITLYGYTQETYEKVTAIPGSHRRCLRAIDLLLERGIPFKLKTVLMKPNVHEIEKMREFANQLGVSFRYDGLINAGVDGSGRPLSVRLSPQEIVHIDLLDEQRMQGWQSLIDRTKDALPDQAYLYTCGAGLHSFHIDPYGELSLCMMARSPAYDLRRGSFRQGWEQFLRDVRFQPVEKGYNCNQCKLLSLCSQCPGWAQMEHGKDKPNRPVAFLCQVAHLREKAIKNPDSGQLQSNRLVI